MKLPPVNIETISFVVPTMSEESNLEVLFDSLSSHMETLGLNYEVLFIEAGSTDNTWREMARLAVLNPGIVRALRSPQPVAQHDAPRLGISQAIGDVIFTITPQLQGELAEIPRFLEKIQDGFGIVAACREKTPDSQHKAFPSRFTDLKAPKAGESNLHDRDCGFIAYRREVAKQLPVSDESVSSVPFDSVEIAEVVVQSPLFKKVKREPVLSNNLYNRFISLAPFRLLDKYRDQPKRFLGRVAIAAGILAVILFKLSLIAAILEHHAVGLFGFSGTVCGVTTLLSSTTAHLLPDDSEQEAPAELSTSREQVMPASPFFQSERDLAA
ncbi:MAG: glycosyltransferase [Verrucomicrobiota bacterium JB023]|nr:glycosyltransferase [Verrucomicrobiota bacterium JB023]